MITNATSDLASAMRNSQHGIELRKQLDIAGEELSSGQKADIAKAAQGALDTIFAIDKKLGNLEVFQHTIALAEARSSTAQNSLSIAEQALTIIGVDVLASVNRDDLQSAKTYSNQSRALLSSAVGALNAQVGGQSLFAGAGFDTAALASSDQILTDVAAIMAAAPDATTAMNDVNTYFNDPAGGFETSIYLGSDIDAPDLSISEGIDINPLIRADSQALRDTMRVLAVSAAVSEGAFASDPSAQKAILKKVAEDSVGARDEIIYLRQDIGHAESVISDTSASNSAEKSTLQITRNNIMSADPYETATRLTELQTQLESLYLLTARLSGLTLANYLR